MSILPIYNCYHPVLKKATEDINDFNDDLIKFINDLLETMYNADGVGLAANQVGDSRSIFVVDEFAGSDNPNDYKPIVMINPKIISFSSEQNTYLEGCLSIPKFFEDVVRPESIVIEYSDQNMKSHRLEANEFLARVIQHEFDHLKGILFIERLSGIKKSLSKSKLKKIKQGIVNAHYNMINPDDSLILARADKEND